MMEKLVYVEIGQIMAETGAAVLLAFRLHLRFLKEQ